MRARIGPSLPGLAHFFGVRPWEVGLLTPGELIDMLEELADIAHAQRQ